MFESVDLNALLPRQNQDLEQNDDDDDGSSWLPSLSWRERVIGCVACLVMGYLLSFGSFFRLTDLLKGNPLPFVINATVGNIIALCGSCFLSGPKSQYDKMFSETRKHATVAYLLSLVLTLVVAFIPPFWGQSLLLLILLIIQYFAIGWYCLSYIPFARDMLRGWFNRFVSGDD
mmetsp:Transcript_34825/g.51775  ORF Transcript_34825/g.51775 Transcript_34825/m.51775 type:complete len:174 (+) Transcript_34825:118-639(+)